MAEKLTAKQRWALEHREGSRREGLTLSAYAGVHGLSVREIYDALAALRRKGVLPRPVPGAKSRFVAVRVQPEARPTVPTMTRSAMICRVLIGSTAVLECGEWPPVAWLTALLTGRADAAP